MVTNLVSLASLLVLRFLAVLGLNSLIPDGTDWADSSFLAMWFMGFAIADCGFSLLLFGTKHGTVPACILYASAAWSALLALEQALRWNALLPNDGAAQLIFTIALLLAWTWEAATWIRSRSQASSPPR